MDKLSKFIAIVQTEVLFEAMRSEGEVSPGGLVALAMTIPTQHLPDDEVDMHNHALDLVAWYVYGTNKPYWVPDGIDAV